MKTKRILILAVTALALLSARADDAKVQYDKLCAKCHGADGKGNTKMGKKLNAKDYTDAKVQAELKDDKAFKAVREGLKDGTKTVMKPDSKLTDKEIKDLIAHLRTFKK